MTETHIFLVSRTCDRSSNAHVLAQDLTVRMFELRCTFAHPKSHPYTTCFIVHSMTYLTHFLPFLPHHLLQTSLPSAGIRMKPTATPSGGMLFGRLAEQGPLTLTGQDVLCGTAAHDFRSCALEGKCLHLTAACTQFANRDANALFSEIFFQGACGQLEFTFLVLSRLRLWAPCSVSTEPVLHLDPPLVP